MRGTRWVVECKQGGVKLGGVKPGEAEAKNLKSRRNLKLSLRGSVEMQAQQWVGSDEQAETQIR